MVRKAKPRVVTVTLTKKVKLDPAGLKAWKASLEQQGFKVKTRARKRRPSAFGY